MKNNIFKFDEGQNSLENLILAYILCAKLSEDFDKKDLSKVGVVGSALNEFPEEIILLSVRKFISLKRIVIHNLKEDPLFGKCLVKAIDLTQ